ncbi:MAG: recombinase family protein [bacterium]
MKAAKESLRVYGYARVSTMEQVKGLSIEVQHDQIRKYAGAQPEWNLERIHTDPGASGGDFNRPGFKKLQKKIEAGDVDVIVVTKLDRLVRSLLHMLRFIENELEPRGVRFVSLSEGIDSSKKGMNKVFMQVLSAFSEMERTRIKERCGEGQRKNASLGRLNGPAPYGYKKDGNRIAIAPEEAKIIRRLFRTFNKGERGLKSIADEFEIEGVVNRKGKPFAHSTLLGFIKNEFYTGCFIWGKNPRDGAIDSGEYMRIENNHPAIIKVSDFERAQHVLTNRGQGFPARERGEFVLSGILFDRHGHRMKGMNIKKRDKPVVGYYACSINSGSGPGKGLRYCRQRRVEAVTVENMVMKKLKEQMAVLSGQVEESAVDKLFTDAKFQEMEAALKKELQETQSRAARLFEGFLDGAVRKKKFEEANKQLAADEEYLKGKLEEIEDTKKKHRAIREMDRATLKKLTDDFEYFNRMRPFTRKKLLHQMIEKVVINSRKGSPVQLEEIIWREGFE